MDWWVTKGDRRPVGPVSTEFLLQRIGAGKVPRDALVCEVGGTSWRWICETAPFSATFSDARMRRRLDSVDELTIVDPGESGEPLTRFEAGVENTTTVTRPDFPASEPPPMRQLQQFDDPEEHTTVDLPRFPTSEPPTEP